MAAIELTAAQVRELQALDQVILTLQTTLQRATRAGLDVSEVQQRLDDANAKRVGLLREFTPGVATRRAS